MLDLSLLYEKLPREIELAHPCSANPRIAEDSTKLVIDIDAPDFVASLSAWSNGCVDLDVILRGASDGIAWHGEFSNDEAALEQIIELLRGLPDLPGPRE
jgi:hypothetical protein